MVCRERRENGEHGGQAEDGGWPEDETAAKHDGHPWPAVNG